ncbi:MAG: hypothetical protein Q7T82_00365 [Armatimonadota bacterium]|nr:hypothetical protein [Armatimonadota bacterium]
MGEMVEVNDEGNLVLPQKTIGSVDPHTRYVVEFHGKSITLRPVEGEEFWANASRQEWVASFLDWANSPRPVAPILPDEALRRESMYD